MKTSVGKVNVYKVQLQSLIYNVEFDEEDEGFGIKNIYVASRSSFELIETIVKFTHPDNRVIIKSIELLDMLYLPFIEIESGKRLLNFHDKIEVENWIKEAKGEVFRFQNSK